MPSVVENLIVDCADPYALAQFWSEVTGRPLLDGDQPGDPEAIIVLENGVQLYFSQVPEVKTVKNRLHLCLAPDVQRDVEVKRLLELGATMVADRRKPDGKGWAVLGDPEGNEFCILRSAAERAAAGD
ncbi:MAG: hypothetical protein QOI21_6015 [Actinomycetota bacterium]|jgi:predicted enzyme related to lactoylglutathione lyase|nr:hypothetical protein [Actinomycetota bacterium]